MYHKFTVASVYTLEKDVKNDNSRFQELLDITIPNKQEYCKRHGYELVIDNCTRELPENKKPFRGKYDHYLMHLLQDIIRQKTTDWICWMDPDVLIMNHTIKLEYFIDDCYDLIIGEDWNGINTGVYFCKSNNRVLEFLDKCLEYEPTEFDRIQTPYWWWPSYQCAFTRSMCIVNARIVHHSLFNGYIFGPEPTNVWASIGSPNFVPKIFEKGDFILHFASNTVADKIKNAQKYIRQVIK